MNAYESWNYQKLVKDALNLASFYGSHIDGIVFVKQIGKDLKEIHTNI